MAADSPRPGAPDEPVHETVAAFLLPDVATLIDCGAAANLHSLEAELARHGTAIEGLDHLLLTHIHLDHAGAAGALAARNPICRCGCTASARAT